MTKGIKRKILIIFTAIIIITSCVLIFTNIYKIFIPIFNSGVEIDDSYGDMILVLGGGLRKGLKIGFSTKERLILAIELYKEKKRKILISDGSLYKGSKAIKIFKDFMLKNGVPESDFILEGKSQTTYQNFKYSEDIIKKNKGKQIIICTSPYHQKRADMIAIKMNIFNYKIAKMKESEIFVSNSLKKRLRNIKLLLREIGAIIKFKLFWEGK